MKLKHLFAAALMAVCGSAWAQTDVTSTYLTNAGFDTQSDWQASNVAAGSGKNSKNVDGWTSNGGAAWSSSAAFGFGGTGQINTAAIPEKNSNGASEGGALGISTGWSGTVQYTQTVTLPAGAYKFSYTAMNVFSDATNNTSKCGYKIGSGNYTYTDRTTWQANTWVTDELTFDLAEESEVTFALGLTAGNSSSSNNSKVLFDYVKLLQVPYATAQDIEALNTAISTVDSYVIGFAQGEYAPYTNVAAVNALKTAKEISASAESGNVDELSVTNATSALNDATWTVNTAEMNAIYDGTFALTTAESGGYTVPTGWTNLGYNTRVYNQNNKGSNSGVDAGSEGACLFAKYETSYGTVAGYEMPLKAGGYSLKFIYGGWGETGARNIKIYKVADNDTKATVTPNKVTAKNGSANSNQDDWSEYDGIVRIPSDGNYVLEFGKTTNAQNQIVISDIKLFTVDLLALAKEKFAEQQIIANGHLENAEYAGVTGSERTELQTKAADLADDLTEEQVNSATEELKAAITAFTDAKDTYAKYDAQTANAKIIGVTDKALTNARPESASDLQNALNRIIVLEDQAATAGYTQDATNIFGTWTQQNTGSTSGQHWSGDSRSYIDKNSTQGFTMSVTNNVTLPAGKYVFKAAARMAKNYNNYGFRMSAKIGENTIEQNFIDKGSEGLGIDKTGAANYTESADTYCNDNKGRGWEWRFIGFELQEETEVTMSVYAQVLANGWVSFTDITLLTTDDNEAIVAQLVAKAKEELLGVIDAAPSETANVGTGAFQIPSAAASTYADAKTAVQDAHDAQDATLASIAEAKSTFETAITTFRAVELNAPANDKKFNLVLTSDGWTYDNKAITYIANGRKDAGNYNIQYSAEANANYAQAFTMTKVEGNKYKMSQIDNDGEERYICTGVFYKGNTSQIRTTTDADQALQVQIIPTSTEGVYNLWNTEANQYIGSQDAGVYTVNANINFTITEAAKATANLKITAAKYGTFIAPFAVELPTGVTAYSVEVDDTSAKLNKIAEGGETLPANTPAVVYSESEVNKNVEGWGLATAASYTDDKLTGVYALTAVTAYTNKYMLQNGENGVAFYLVNQDAHIGANRCYLTATSGIKALIFDTEADAIQNIEVAEGNGAIYDLSGRKVSKAQKGLYIVNGRKVVK